MTTVSTLTLTLKADRNRPIKHPAFGVKYPGQKQKSICCHLFCDHLLTLLTMSGEEILIEYLIFLRDLPDLISIEKEKLVNIVKKEWNIDHLLENIHKLDFERHLMNIGEGNNLIDQLSTKLGQSLRVICPHVKNCQKLGSK